MLKKDYSYKEFMDTTQNEPGLPEKKKAKKEKADKMRMTKEEKFEAKKEKKDFKTKLQSIFDKSEIPKKLVSQTFTVFDFGSYSIKVLEGKLDTNSFKVSIFNEIPLPNNYVSNGKIIKFDEVCQIVSNNLDKSFNKRHTIVTTESLDVIRREIEIPYLSLEDSEGMLNFEMKQFLPVDSFSYNMKYYRSDIKEIEDGSKMATYQVFAMPKDIIQPYFNLMDIVKFKPYALDLHSNGMRKLMELEYEINPHLKNLDFILIDMGHSSFNIQFYQDGKYVYNRLIDNGGKEITRAFTQAISVESDKANEMKEKLLSEESIFEIYQELSLDLRRRGESSEEKIFKNAVEIVDDWVRNIDSVIKFYNTQPFGRSHPIDQIFLYGGSSKIKDIERLFESRLGISTKKIEELEMTRDDEYLTNNLPVCLNAVSSLIRY